MGIYDQPTFEIMLREKANKAFEAIVAAVARETCTLSRGSAVHAKPPQEHPAFELLKGKFPPAGSQLSKILADQCKYAERFPNDDVRDLQRVSQYYESENGRG